MIGLPIGELAVGQVATLTRLITPAMIAKVSHAIGDENPLHSDAAFAARVSFPHAIAPGVLTGGVVSAAIGTLLPGPGTLYMSQETRFLKPVYPGDTVTAHIEVVELIPQRNRARLKTTCLNQHGEEVLAGDAWVKPPKERIEYQEEAVAPRMAPAAIPLAWSAAALRTWCGATAALLGAWRRESGI